MKRHGSYMVVQAGSYSPVGGDARIKVIGVGGGGGNALNRMIASGLQVSARLTPQQCYVLLDAQAQPTISPPRTPRLTPH